MNVRLAKEEELNRINELRKQVNDLHAEGKPEIFKAGFEDDLRDFLFQIREDPEKEIVVAEENGTVVGFAVLNHIFKPENPYMYEREYVDIDEFCVDKDYRRQGVASALIDFIKAFAKEKGFKRIELNMWEFNQDALAFYEEVGFETYRRYMEMRV